MSFTAADLNSMRPDALYVLCVGVSVCISALQCLLCVAVYVSTLEGPVDCIKVVCVCVCEGGKATTLLQNRGKLFALQPIKQCQPLHKQTHTHTSRTNPPGESGQRGAVGGNVVSILEGHILLSASLIRPLSPLSQSFSLSLRYKFKGRVMLPTEVIGWTKNATVHSVQLFTHSFPSMYSICEEYVR